MPGLGLRAGDGRRPVTSGTFGAWNPANVPEVAAGYFWLASSGTGLGTSGFTVPEGNGHTTFDLVQTTVASQPTALTELGGTQYRMRHAADANPSIIKTAGSVQAGWTGNTYLAGWFRMPNGSGDITGPGNLFAHTTTTALRLVLANLINSTDRQGVVFSGNGTSNTASNQWLNCFPNVVGGRWTWLEMLVVPGSAIDLVADFTTQNRVLTTAPGATLNDTNATISVGCRGAANLANVDPTDWCAVYYANGIPSDANRLALYRHNAPV